jgi:signal peptidase I
VSVVKAAKQKGSPHAERRAEVVSWLLTITFALGLFALVRTAGLGLYVITTDSMEPTLQPRDFVVAVSPEWTRPRVGSMVVFAPQFAGQSLPRHVHRIVGTYRDGTWATRGDNASGMDPWHVTPNQVQGVVRGVVFPAKVTQNIWVVGVGTMLLVLYFLWPQQDSDTEHQSRPPHHAAKHTAP